LLNHCPGMGNDLAKELSVLVCWLWRKLGWCVLTKRQLGALVQLQVQVRQDPQKSVFGLLAQAMVVKPSARYGERFGKRIKCVGLLVVKKTWLMYRWTVAVSCVSPLASSCYIRPTGGSFWRFDSRVGC
jgi:hypothetical protein